jgi:hypothetical protein
MRDEVHARSFLEKESHIFISVAIPSRHLPHLARVGQCAQQLAPFFPPALACRDVLLSDHLRMSSMLTPPLPPGSPLRIADDADIGDWLDALAAGECTQDQYLDEMRRRKARDPGVFSEVLALLEQRHAQHRISHFLYVCIRARLRRPGPGEQGGERAAVAAPREVKSPAPAAVVPAATPEPVAPAARSMPAMSAVRSTAPVSVPAMRSQPAIATPPPAPTPTTPETAQPASLQVGTVLPGGYRVMAVQRQDAGGTLLEAIAERKAGLSGVRSRLSIHVVHGASARDSVLLQRIGRLQTLSHPGILRVLDVEEADGSLLVIMEPAEGTTLHELMERNEGRRLATSAALTILRSVAGALLFAHTQGVSHGDISPQNIVVAHSGEVRLQNFLLRRGYDMDLAGDRMGFARLAYFLLSGFHAPVGEPVWGPVRLIEPAGLTRRQWRALRDALRLEHYGSDVLAAFAGGNQAIKPLALPLGAFEAGAVPPRRVGVTDWLAVAVVVALLGGGAYFLFGARPGEVDATPAAVAAPVPEVASRSPPPVAPVIAPAPGAGPGSVAAEAPAPSAPEGAAPQLARPVIELSSRGAWVDTTSPVARIWVRRRGSLEQAVSFQWWTENGSAKDDRDFIGAMPSVAVIPSGARGVELRVPLIPDAPRREPRTFFVKIDRARGARLGESTLLQVAIVPPDYPANRDGTGAGVDSSAFGNN